MLCATKSQLSFTLTVEHPSSCSVPPVRVTLGLTGSGQDIVSCCIRSLSYNSCMHVVALHSSEALFWALVEERKHTKLYQRPFS